MKKILLILFIISVSYAHLEGDARISGDHRIEFASLPDQLEVGKNSDLVITIENATTGERIAGTRLWSRLSLDNAAVFSTPSMVTDASGAAILNYNFPAPGNYRLDVSVDGQPAVSFNVSVAGNSHVPVYIAATAAVFFVIGLASGFIFLLRMRK